MSSGRVVIGGKVDEKDNYIEPTVMVDCKPDDPAMTEEVNKRFYRLLNTLSYCPVVFATGQ